MRKFILISGAAVSLFTVGCATPEVVCMSSVNQVCDRLFECQSEQVKSSEQFKSAYGTDAQECKTKLYATQKCTEKKEDNDNCADGKTFHLDKASECSAARAAQSCTDYLDSNKLPAVCTQVCT